MKLTEFLRFTSVFISLSGTKTVSKSGLFSFSMAKQIQLQALTRSGAGRSVSKQLRRDGRLPAVIYGAKQAALNLSLNQREVKEVLSKATGEQVLVELTIDNAGAKSSSLALIQHVQHHPLSPDIVHMDFHAISADEVIHAHVSVETTGEPVVVKTFGGLLEIQLHSVEVECLPKDLPDVITIDVSALNLSDAVHVRDLVLPEGVKARLDGDVTVLRVSNPTGDVKTDVDAPSQPEVIREKKEDADKK